MNDRIRAVALGNNPADLLLQNGRVVDVLTETIYEADVAIADGKIAAIGPRGTYTKAKQVLNLQGAYIAPGLIAMWKAAWRRRKATCGKSCAGVLPH